MGKEGNKRRRQTKREKEAAAETAKQFQFDENIQRVLAEDGASESQQGFFDALNEFHMTREQINAAEVSILGPPGPPTDDPFPRDPFGRDIPVPRHDNVIYLGAPPKTKRKVVDCLGRVVEIEDQIPEVLRAPMAKRTTEINPLMAVAPKRRVTLMRDHTLTYPELWMEIFVQPDPAVRDDEARFAQMFARSRCTRAKSVLEADLVVFAGGDDVDPSLYGEVPHNSTCSNPKRDETDIALYNLCVEHGIPMLGVCRGAQFLHVMNKGKLWQHVDQHYGDHRIWDIRKKEFIEKVSSVHHQMCRPNRDNGQEILATNGNARNRWANPDEKALGAKADIEAFFYRDTCCLGVQGHPEYQGYNYFTKWVLDLINEYVLLSPDIEWTDRNRRLKKEFIEERNNLAAAKKEKN